MKILTKEWVKELEFHDLIIMLEPKTNKKVPFIFTNGGTENVEKKDLYTIKTNLNVTEKENEINFIMLPDTLDLKIDFLGNGEEINEKTCKNDFLLQYLNRLRIISYIPKDILKNVKDKRLLALGYAEETVKKEILKYIRSKYRNAYDLYKKCNETSVLAEKGLTIHNQFKNHFHLRSVPALFDGVKITKFEKVKDEIYLTLDDCENIVFNEAEITEQEIDILNSCVCGIELYKKESLYELRFLLTKTDNTLISHYHYATLTFRDLKFYN